MSDVIDLAARRRERAVRGPRADGSNTIDGSAIVGRHVARVRAIGAAAWHPSLGVGPMPWGSAGTRRTGPAHRAIDRLERAMHRIEGIDGSPGGARLRRSRTFDPRVETELLAIVGQLSLGLVNDAADRAERVADELGDTAASRS
jgi:hypothetical protein